MIAYTTFGTNDLNRSTAFYDTIFAELGIKRLWQFDRGVVWGTSAAAPSFGVLMPFDGQAATAGNGTMVALVVPSQDLVRRVHAKALALGAVNEGDPGARQGEQFYCAYFRDLDGNKLNLFCTGPAA